MRAILAIIDTTPSRDPEDDSAVDDADGAEETCAPDEEEAGTGYEWGAGLGLDDLGGGSGDNIYDGHTLVVALGETWNEQQHPAGSPPQYSLAYDEKFDSGAHTSARPPQVQAARPVSHTEVVLPPTPTRSCYRGRPYKRLRGFGFDLGPPTDAAENTSAPADAGGVSGSDVGSRAILTDAPPPSGASKTMHTPPHPPHVVHTTPSLAKHASPSPSPSTGLKPSLSPSPSPSVAPTSSPKSCQHTKDGVCCRLPTLGDTVGPQDDDWQELSITSDHTLASFHLALRDESGHTVYTDGWARVRVAKNDSWGGMEGVQGATGVGESTDVHEWPLKAAPVPLDVVDGDRGEGCHGAATTYSPFNYTS